MSAASPSDKSDRLVVVVGVDLSHVSEHFLITAANLARPAVEAELHVVHVVAPAPLPFWIEAPLASTDLVTRARVEYARWELHRLAAIVQDRTDVRIILHTPVGEPTRELMRIAREVGAQAIVLEAHDRSGLSAAFHRSVAARVCRRAPCSVITVRGGAPAGAS